MPGAGTREQAGGDLPIRVFTPDQVADMLQVSRDVVYQQLRTGALEGIKVGERGVWRVTEDQLRSYLERAEEETRRFVAEHPFREEPADRGTAPG